jgi:hypothetical protein
VEPIHETSPPASSVHGFPLQLAVQATGSFPFWQFPLNSTKAFSPSHVIATMPVHSVVALQAGGAGTIAPFQAAATRSMMSG